MPLPLRPLSSATTMSKLARSAVSATEIVVTAELPGLKPEQVSIDLTGNVLTLKGEKREDLDEKGKNWHRIERSYGTFARSFQLQLVMAFPPERLGVMVPHAQTVVMCQKEVQRGADGYVTRIDNIPMLTTMAEAVEALG